VANPSGVGAKLAGITGPPAKPSSTTSTNHHLNSYEGWTNKFIFTPYEFSIANCMITNFHTPKSTLMMMTAAFAGYDFLIKAYKEAIKEKYQFYSYGDAMLII
jgi:S-adenosylmethionine:tRNA ribosyltransferase-isomerase